MKERKKEIKYKKRVNTDVEYKKDKKWNTKTVKSINQKKVSCNMHETFKNKIKTGGGLLSRVSSTIGAGGLNFCVRNG
ncbi:hypothetical protein F3J23_16260, partial [Chryseobacterium sp. Tr-659]|uniref:hypothetical protein n=1 Tax=Chryseobacterium sp. Tr-659 TaxID=2608340 RepID=UPI0014227E7B